MHCFDYLCLINQIHNTRLIYTGIHTLTIKTCNIPHSEPHLQSTHITLITPLHTTLPYPKHHHLSKCTLTCIHSHKCLPGKSTAITLCPMAANRLMVFSSNHVCDLKAAPWSSTTTSPLASTPAGGCASR